MFAVRKCCCNYSDLSCLDDIAGQPVTDKFVVKALNSAQRRMKNIGITVMMIQGLLHAPGGKEPGTDPKGSGKLLFAV